MKLASVAARYSQRARRYRAEGYDVAHPPTHLGLDRTIDWLIRQAIAAQVKNQRKKG